MTFVAPIEDEGSICPAAVLRCVDWRWRQADQDFVAKELGFANFDLYSWPGGGREILKDNGFKKEFADYIISLSRNLHGIKKLVLLWSVDCDQINKVSSSESEQKCRLDLQKARELLSATLPPELEIILAYSKHSPQGLEYTIID